MTTISLNPAELRPHMDTQGLPSDYMAADALRAMVETRLHQSYRASMGEAPIPASEINMQAFSNLYHRCGGDAAKGSFAGAHDVVAFFNYSGPSPQELGRMMALRADLTSTLAAVRAAC
ncbi:MAG: hypothetical protein AAFX94_00400 [Myxococcota bacterium]